MFEYWLTSNSFCFGSNTFIWEEYKILRILRRKSKISNVFTIYERDIIGICRYKPNKINKNWKEFLEMFVISINQKISYESSQKLFLKLWLHRFKWTIWYEIK